MPDLEELIRRTLQDRQAKALPSQELLVGARTRKRRQRTGLAIVGMAVATAAAVAAPLTVIAYERSTSAAPSPTQSPSIPITNLPGLPNDPAFDVTAPLLGLMVHGPPPIPQPTCTPGQIDATARLGRSAYGVVGVVEMTGDRCAIPMYPGPTALIDAAGQPLDVPLESGSDVGENIRPDLAFHAGSAAWGFAWTGSWCGPAAAAVVLPLTDRPGSEGTDKPRLTVPLAGPQPACTGTSDSTLVRGAPGRRDEPVLPPPANWSALTATLGLPDSPPYTHSLAVTLTNSSDVDVALDPCPQYRVVVYYRYRDGAAQSSNDYRFPCADVSTVPAHGTVRVALPEMDLGDEDNRTPTNATLTFGIAGGITASMDLP